MTILKGKPRSINAEVLDRIIAHAVDLEQYKSYEVRQIVSFLNAEIEPEIVHQLQKYAGRELTVRRLESLRQAIREITVAGYSQLRSDVTDDLRTLSSSEARWNVNMLAATVPISVSFVAPSVAAIREMMREAPIHGRFVKDWLADLAPATVVRVNQQIMIGATMGEGIDQMVRRIAGTQAHQYADGILQRSRRDIETMVRTAVSGVSNSVRQLTYAGNSRVIKAVLFVATLDLRTCEICGSFDGNRYEIDEGPRPPLHPGCRCTTAPVLRSWRELGLNLQEAPEWTRASMDGQVPARVDFSTWLGRRSVAEQDRVLGQTRGTLYRSGQVKFRDFVDAEDKTRLLTLAELERRL
jgi:SPP1 gp7 family putative phage head morphogenesis protein